MPNLPSDFNPYSSPENTPTRHANSISFRDLVRLKQFRTQTLMLGVVWLLLLFIAAVSLAFSILNSSSALIQTSVLSQFVIGMFILGWGIAALGTFLRTTWGLYTGLVTSYFGLAICAFASQVPPLIFQLVILIQTHALLHVAIRLQRSGISLTSKPDQYTVL